MKRIMLIGVILMFALLTNVALADITTFSSGATDPRNLVISSDDQYLYIANGNDGAGYVTKIRLSDYEIVDSVSTGFDPWCIAITPDGQFLYVTNTVNGYYTTKIDVPTFTSIVDISGGTDPSGLAISADGSKVVIANFWSSFLQVVSVDTDDEICRISGISNGAFDVVITPDDIYAYAIARGAGPNPGTGLIKTSLVDCVALDTIQINGGMNIDITPDGSQIWIPGHISSDNVYVLSTLTDMVIDSIAVGARPSSVHISQDGNFAYVACELENTLYKINICSREVIGFVTVGDLPLGITSSADGSKIYVACVNSDNIYEIDDWEFEDGTEIWCDGFECYEPESSICGTSWICSGNNSCIVDSSISYNGNQSARLYGVIGGCWAAVADRLLETSFPMTIEFAVRNGTEELSGCHPYRASVILRDGSHWTDPVALSLCNFLENGDLEIWVSDPHDSITGFSLEQWYKLGVEIFLPGDDSVHVRFWNDDNYLGEYTKDLAVLPNLLTATHLDISAQEGTAWFDDICINEGLIFSKKYLPGDVNMALGLWPPSVIGGDVSYLVGYFIGAGNAPCRLDDFWASADVNGDCQIIGGDVTTLVSYFIGGGNISYCPDYPPTWLTPDDLPEVAPDGWPNCDTPVINSRIIPAKPVKECSQNNRVTITEPILSTDQKEAIVDVYLASNDPVAFICLPLAWQSKGMTPSRIEPGPALADWDAVNGDIKHEENYMLMLAWHDLGGQPNKPLNTNGEEVLIYQIVLNVEDVSLISDLKLTPTIDPRNGGILLGHEDGITTYYPDVQIDWSAEVLVKGNDPELPIEFSISQNFPNPFNPTTTIDYALPEASHVTLQVYDILGRKAMTLISEHKQPGFHQVTWDAADQTSGVYFYRIQAGDYTETKKMLLLK